MLTCDRCTAIVREEAIIVGFLEVFFLSLLKRLHSRSFFIITVTLK